MDGLQALGVLSVLVYSAIAAALAWRRQAAAGSPATVVAQPAAVAGEGVVTAARVAGEAGPAGEPGRLDGADAEPEPRPYPGPGWPRPDCG